jgi:hypothetical protein
MMARRKQPRSASSGAPGFSNGMGGPALNPLGLSQRGGVNYLDPSVALQEIEHPSAKWAGVELQPCKPRI